MAYSIFKVVGISNGIVQAVPVYVDQNMVVGEDATLVSDGVNKFTLTKASHLEVITPTGLFNASFNYKDKF